MKTKELKEIAERNGYALTCDKNVKNFVLLRSVFDSKNKITISRWFKNRLWIENLNYTTDADIVMMEAAIAYAKTPLEDREQETRYIVPLPGLITTDGEQQYLTHKKGHFFASRRNKDLRQTWKKKNLCDLPEQYRIYAVEVEE